MTGHDMTTFRLIGGPFDGRERVFRDPVYGNIAISSPPVLDCIDSPEFQRLRRIHQLGMCHMVYYGAEHSRFQHSIGAMWLMHRIVSHWRESGRTEISDDLVRVATLAALLHDVGHGPFSHALEHVFSNFHHEAIGNRIVGERLRPLLEGHDVDVDLLLAIMRQTAGMPWLSELISSQIDVDRMDYLLRDSHYTGVRYGLFDIDRIVYTLTPIPDRDNPGRYILALSMKGAHAAEEYLFSRHSMYWQVYFHKTTRACEVLLKSVLARARAVHAEGGHIEIPPDLQFMFDAWDPRSEEWLEAFIGIDDNDVYHAIKSWRRSNDPTLSDLSSRFIDRRPFKALALPCDDPALIDELRSVVETVHHSNTPWYFHVDRSSDTAYDLYTARPGTPAIRVLTLAPDTWQEITEVAQTRSLQALSEQVTRACVMVPESCVTQARQILERYRLEGTSHA